MKNILVLMSAVVFSFASYASGTSLVGEYKLEDGSAKCLNNLHVTTYTGYKITFLTIQATSNEGSEKQFYLNENMKTIDSDLKKSNTLLRKNRSYNEGTMAFTDYIVQLTVKDNNTLELKSQKKKGAFGIPLPSETMTCLYKR